MANDPVQLLNLIWNSAEAPQFAAYGYRCYIVNDKYVTLYREGRGDDTQYISTGTTLDIAICQVIDHITG